MLRVGIIGATGYAGAELVRILAGHPQVELTTLTSRQYASKRFETIYPALAGVVDLVCEEYNPNVICDKADLFFTALPHKLPMAYVPELLSRKKRVVDLSADFRIKDAAVYEAHYQPHTAQDLLAGAVYGLTEIYRDQIESANLIGNPGCYPTSVLLPLVPLLRAELIEFDHLIADSKSGVSGAGRAPSLGTHFCEVDESYRAYKVAAHRHNPEMEQILADQAQQPVPLVFVPHLVPMIRGMLSTVYTIPRKGVTEKDVAACLNEFYRDAPFVRLCAEGITPDTRNVRGTNYCDIGWQMDVKRNRLILIAAIDNLVKGAAGQAVQNMNIMLGLNERLGLEVVGLAP